MLLVENWGLVWGSVDDLAPARRLGSKGEDSAKQTDET